MKMYNMQALHRKIDVVLVQILRYNCSETDYSLCKDSPRAGLRTLPGCGFHLRPLQPPPSLENSDVRGQSQRRSTACRKITTLSLQKCPFPWWSGSPSNTGFLGPTPVCP